MNAFITLVLLLLISIIGFTVVQTLAVFPKKSNLFKLSLGYGLGVGMISAEMYVYARLGILWNITNLLTPWVVLVVIYYASNKYKNIFNLRLKKMRLKIKPVTILLLLGIIFSALYTIFEALLRPLAVWDGWATWMIKSKAFFLDSTITASTLKYIASDGPLVVSIIGTFIYIALGKVDDTSVLLVSSGFYVFLLTLFFSVVREKNDYRYALFFTFLLATTQTLIRQGGRLEAGEADLPLGYFIFSSTLLYIEYIKSGSGKVLLLLSFFLGITSLIKFEGLPFSLLIIVLVLYDIFKKHKHRQLPLLMFWLIPVVEWQIYKKITNLDSIYFAGHGLVVSFHKILHSIVGTAQGLTNVKSWNLLWIVYFYCIIFLFHKKNFELVTLHIVVLSQLLLYLLIYFFTAGNTPETSLERLLVHLAPAALLSVSIVAGNKIRRKLTRFYISKQKFKS